MPTAITEAQAEEMKRRSNLFKELSRKYGDGFYKWMKNFDKDDGTILVTVADTVAATEAHLFTVGPAAGNTPRISIADNTGKTGDFILTIKPGTLDASRTVLFPDHIGVDDVIVTTNMAQTITGVKTMTTPILSAPVIADFSSATHTHASAAQGGTISAATNLAGTTSTYFTVNSGATTPEIVIGGGAGTGNFTLSLISPVLSADATITFPAVTGTLAILGANAFTGANSFAGVQTFNAATVFAAGITASGAVANTWAGATGTFITSTGENTLSGNVTISGTKTFTTGTGAAVLKGSATFDTTKTLTFGSASAGTGTPIVMYSLTPVNGSLSIAVADQASNYASILQTNSAIGAAATYTLPSGTCTLSGLALTETFSGNKTITGTLNLRGAVSAGGGGANPNVDLSGSSGQFLTTTGTVTIGPGAVGITGICTFTTMPIIPTTTKAANLASQATATALVTGFNLVTCADGSNTAVVLPAPTAGAVVIVKNGSAQTAKVFPSSGKAINALGADAAYNIATTLAVTFVAYDANTWYTVPLAAS